MPSHFPIAIKTPFRGSRIIYTEEDFIEWVYENYGRNLEHTLYGFATINNGEPLYETAIVNAVVIDTDFEGYLKIKVFLIGEEVLFVPLYMGDKQFMFYIPLAEETDMGGLKEIAKVSTDIIMKEVNLGSGGARVEDDPHRMIPAMKTYNPKTRRFVTPLSSDIPLDLSVIDKMSEQYTPGSLGKEIRLSGSRYLDKQKVEEWQKKLSSP